MYVNDKKMYQKMLKIACVKLIFLLFLFFWLVQMWKASPMVTQSQLSRLGLLKPLELLGVVRVIR